MFLKHTGKTLALFSLLFAAGCSSSGGTGNLFAAAGDKPIKIESIPPGADVYVMGENIGATPIMIKRDRVFPNLYPKEKESLYGKVTLRKAGCLDFTRTISTEIGNYGLHAKLDCGDTNSGSASATASRTSETVEQRLDKVKDLLGKGLITDEEAKKAREHILNGL
ncbi:MAG: PEGA domain-containing protein [Gallionella sp.]